MHVLVTGGSGFLGSHIVKDLLERGHTVRSMTRSEQPELESLGVDCVQGDISNIEDARAAVAGCEAVIHTAAMVGAWGKEDLFERVNVEGTRVMLEASAAANVRYFIFTSSPSVVFDGSPLRDAPQNTPYPTSFPTPYASTKADSEKLALAADNPSGMRTVALRPQLMWGPGDPHLVPMLVEKARAGKLKIVGDGTNRVDITYIDNAASAHLDALDALAREDGPTHPGGKAYFISNGAPIQMWDWISQLMERLGAPRPTSRIPRWLALLAGWLTEIFWKITKRREDPPITRYIALKMSTDQYYDLEPARRDLGYHPRVSMERGLELLLDAQEHSSNRTPGSF